MMSEAYIQRTDRFREEGERSSRCDRCHVNYASHCYGLSCDDVHRQEKSQLVDDETSEMT